MKVNKSAPQLNHYEVIASEYSVGVVRTHAKKSALVRRFLRLSKLVQVSGPPLQLSAISGVGISFFERTPEDFGTFTMTGLINVRAPFGDFVDVYRIVQTESPIHFQWAEDHQHCPLEILSYTLNVAKATVGECC